MSLRSGDVKLVAQAFAYLLDRMARAIGTATRIQEEDLVTRLRSDRLRVMASLLNRVPSATRRADRGDLLEAAAALAEEIQRLWEKEALVPLGIAR